MSFHEQSIHGEKLYSLSPGKYVTASTFQNEVYIHVREYYDLNKNTIGTRIWLAPGKKGIALSVHAFKTLLEKGEEVLDDAATLKPATRGGSPRPNAQGGAAAAVAVKEATVNPYKRLATFSYGDQQ